MCSETRLLETFDLIRDVAKSFQHHWTLIGSAAAYAIGAKVGPIEDVDLLLSSEDANNLAVQWQDRLLEPLSESKQFRSNPFFRFKAPLTIEVMANFEIYCASNWQPVSVATGIFIDGLSVPSLDEQLRLLKMMDRRKDASRIIALEQLRAE